MLPTSTLYLGSDEWNGAPDRLRHLQNFRLHSGRGRSEGEGPVL